MTLKPLLFCLISFFSFSLIEAQTVQQQKDSILAQVKSADPVQKASLYDSVSRLKWGSNSDSSIYYAQLALEYAKKTRDDLTIANAYNTLGNIYLGMGENDEALDNYKKSLSLRNAAGDMLQVSNSLRNMGLIYINQKKYSEAINAYKEGAAICNKINKYSEEAYMQIGIAFAYRIIYNRTSSLEHAIKASNLFILVDDKSGLAYAYNFIGTLHRELINNSLALEYFKKANQLYKELNAQRSIAEIANNLGIVFYEMGQNDKALAYYKEFLQMSIENGEIKSQATAYNNIGFVYAKTKQYQKALEAYSKSLFNSQKTVDSINLMNTYNNIGSVYYSLGNLSKAENSVNTALRYTPKNKDLMFFAESHEILNKIYTAKKDFTKAHHHLSINAQIKDSLFSIKTNEQMVEMQVRFETEHKEKEIELLKKNNEIRNLEFQKQKNANFLWIGLIILLIGFGILGYLNLQQKKKNNRLLQGKNEQLEITIKKLVESEQNLTELNATKDKFFSIIAHDLKNPFSALLGFSELLKNNYASYSQKVTEEIINTIYDASHSIYRLLENLLQWSRSQTGRITYNPELFPLNKLVRQEIELLYNLSEKKNIKIINKVEESVIIFADPNLVSVIIRNLLGNAIKFCNLHGKVEITATEQNNMVAINITDSGVGMSKSETERLFKIDKSFSTKGTANEEGTGLGLIVCKEFIEKNYGKIYVISQKDYGSTFTFTLPTNKSGTNV